jgi:small ligand-binding sensory domain FIST
MAQSEGMIWASGLSERVDPRTALREAHASALEALGGAPDLALVFVSSMYAKSYDAIAEEARACMPENALGCSAVGVIGGGREIERREAISVVLARLPGARVRVFHLEAMPRDDVAWLAVTGVAPSAHDDATFLLLADSFSLELEAALERFDAAYPRAVKLGGVTSGASAAGESALYYKGGLLRDGLVGVSIQGGHKLLPVVAQGCRPIGEPMIITRCRDSVIQELNVGRPIDALQRTFKGLPPRDQELGRHSLFVGIEMRSGTHRYGHGDFLVREVAGIDPQSGAMAIGGRCQDYQVVQFHLRDAQTSARDLEAQLATVTRDLGAQAAGAALIFSCLGRGVALYDEPNHDTDKVVSALGALPVGGFFGSGEIGPVGGRTFLHGYTSAIAVFAPRTD